MSQPFTIVVDGAPVATVQPADRRLGLLPVEFHEGDTAPAIDCWLMDRDLSDHTLRLALTRPSDSIEVVADLVEPASGVFRFTWGPTDLVAGVGQRAKIIDDDNDGTVETVAEFLIDVAA